ncbi:hypothetical protein H2198_004475 [Neophaeococcomyces mojaviensis]|uniref:Uncharacterized protein n=1 Tax=Neophaeococcomyces mojaviensis TaxID=3383035 RepID=A0ACC3A8N8_9EURO|nr:hypothetical protein H2198_004475 [Knufia sp. JES_112]
MSIYADIGDNGEGLVWGSEVKIEIVSQLSKRTSIDSSTSSPRTSIDPDCFSKLADNRYYSVQRLPQLRVDTAHSVESDADDEGSLHLRSPLPDENLTSLVDVRGRPGSRTKQLRRRGMDLSRDELRISSRWSSREKRSMEDFRDAIREKVNGVEGADDAWIRWTEKRHPILQEARIIRNRVSQNLIRSVSRGRSRKPRRSTQKDSQRTFGLHNHEQVRQEDFSLQPVRQERPQMTLRQVQSNMSMPKGLSLSSLDKFPSNTRVPANIAPIPPVKCDHRQTSWQRHLHYDLQPRSVTNRELHHKRGRYILQQSSDDKEYTVGNKQAQPNNILPSNSSPAYNHRTFSSTRYLLQPSLESCQDIEVYHRLPSFAASTEVNRSGFWPPQNENISDTISSGEPGTTQQDADNTTSIASSSPTSRQASDHSATCNLVHAIRNDIHNHSPDVSHTASLPHSPRKTQAIDHRINADKANFWMYQRGRLVSSISVPDTLERCGSSHQHDEEDDESFVREIRSLALHPLTTRLPHENLVRPSIGVGLKSWASFEVQDAKTTE